MDREAKVTQRIKALHDVDLKSANAELESILRSDDFLYVARHDLNNDEFFVQALDKFNFRIVGVEEGFKMDEPEYGCIFNTARFKLQMRNYDDLLAQVIHTCLHEWCELAWINTPVPKHSFTAIELDVLEELYGQALMSHIAPYRYELFPDNLREYFEFVNKNTEDTKPVFDKIFGLMTFAIGSKVENPQLCAVMTWLYANNVREQRTFAQFIVLCNALIHQTDFRSVIQEYYDLLGTEIEWA
jgi:hypothetical protein